MRLREATDDYWHDLKVNKIGRERAKSGQFTSSKDACADYREQNKALPEEYWQENEL